MVRKMAGKCVGGFLTAKSQAPSIIRENAKEFNLTSAKRLTGA
ncbi:hypothetical protein SAMN05216420_1031 [Nitrosospira sp. Nl5]|nr:hypothetical protein SAMN05216420_1031 [Nitrosospira sp. Nl5]